jgi:hypothetical protein
MMFSEPYDDTVIIEVWRNDSSTNQIEQVQYVSKLKDEYKEGRGYYYDPKLFH